MKITQTSNKTCLKKRYISHFEIISKVEGAEKQGMGGKFQPHIEICQKLWGVIEKKLEVTVQYLKTWMTH